MVSRTEIAELLETLHANGYRLRKIGPDALEVEDLGPKLVANEPEPQREHKDPEDESPLWDHVGGKPGWVRDPKPRGEKSPWSDDVGRES